MRAMKLTIRHLRVLQCGAVCCSVLQCVAVCYSVLRHLHVLLRICHVHIDSVLQCVAVCCSVVQCVAVCYAICMYYSEYVMFI